MPVNKKLSEEEKFERIATYLMRSRHKMAQPSESDDMSNQEQRRTDETTFASDNGDSGVNVIYTSSSPFSTPRNSVVTMPNVPISGSTSSLGPMYKKYSRNQDYIQRNVTPTSADSIRTMPEMSPTERVRLIKRNLTVMFSCIYAVFLVVLGGVIYINFEGPGNRFVSEVFSAMVAFMGLVWLMFFHIDLFRYKRRIVKKMIQASDEQMEGTSYSTDFNLPEWADEDLNPPYRFLTGRHSGSFYLKAGLAAFCFGHLINEGLSLGQEILNYIQEDRYLLDCGEPCAVLVHCIRPIYSFYQLFIVFKYSNIVINQYKEIARFALMHTLANCILFWFSAIVQDALEDYNHKLSEIASKNSSGQHAPAYCNIMGSANDSKCICASNAMLSVNNLQAIPYLYPFTVEFNLLLAGVWFIVWHNIGKHHRANPHHFRHKINNNDDGIEEITFQSNLVISADCHASNKGLFAGLFLLMTSIISVIVFFVAMSGESYVRLGLSIHTTQEFVLSVVALVCVVLSYNQLSQLDFNLHPITFLDDVLMFIPLPFYFVHYILSMAADIHGNNYSRIAVSTLTILQVILQTPLICDGLRRCSNTQSLRFKKPGREIITFLIVCNLTMWIVNTFEEKSIEPHLEQHHYYGEFLWMFIGHTTLPLMLFYRFHASVCLADIWKSAYEKGE